MQAKIERNEIKMLIENNQRHTMLVAVEIFRISKSSVKNNFHHHDFVREKKSNESKKDTVFLLTLIKLMLNSTNSIFNALLSIFDKIMFRNISQTYT